MNSNGEVVSIRVAEQEIIRDAVKVLFKLYPIDSSEATTVDDTGGGRRFVCGDVAGDEMMIGVGNFRYVYVRDEAVI